MKRPLLKILPGVAVVLLSPSCSKDDDNAVKDDVTIVAEKVKESKVFYLKVKNSPALSKMTIEGLGTAGEKALQFQDGDQLTIEFSFSVKLGDDSDVSYQTIYAKATALYKPGTGFKVYTDPNANMDDEISTTPIEYSDDYGPLKKEEDWKAYTGSDYTYTIEQIEGPAATALAEMVNETTSAEAASKYGVTLTWGDEEILNKLYDQQYIPYSKTETMTAMEAMLKAAPRRAEKSFTLQQDGSYSFIVFAPDCGDNDKEVTVAVKNKEGEIIDEKLAHSNCYIISPASTVKVNGVKKNLESGKIYYVKPNPES